MGVQGLWTLLEPVGRRVNIEAIANKRLAIGGGLLLFGANSAHNM
jgi:DNA excision repair protein ERCC-5